MPEDLSSWKTKAEAAAFVGKSDAGNGVVNFLENHAPYIPAPDRETAESWVAAWKAAQGPQ